VTTVSIWSPAGTVTGEVDLPEDVFGVQVNVPLLHQVVVAQLAAARQGTASTKTRGEVSGGGRKPYRQKGTGRARQGSIRAPQFAGGGTVFGPTPRSYEQKTPKKMKAAALRGALSDRARNGRVHVVAALLDSDVPSTRTAVRSLAAVSERARLLVVAERADVLTWKSLRNAGSVHLIAPDQLNTYDVLVSDDVVFTEAALTAFLAGSRKGRAVRAVASSAELVADDPAPAGLSAPMTEEPQVSETPEPQVSETPEPQVSATPATSAGTTAPAGAGLSTEQLADEVLEQTDSNLLAETAYESEGGDVPSQQEVEAHVAERRGDEQ
jgi:large subunit ribosomal protein L4